MNIVLWQHISTIMHIKQYQWFRKYFVCYEKLSTKCACVHGTGVCIVHPISKGKLLPSPPKNRKFQCTKSFFENLLFLLAIMAKHTAHFRMSLALNSRDDNKLQKTKCLI